MKILILCTGNSCRSQIAEGFLKSFDNNLIVFSAGTNPAPEVNPFAIKVMKEIGIDISKNKPKHVEQFLNEDWDYVITVCDDANESCPIFPGLVKNRIHIGFEDPAKIVGEENHILKEFRRIRDQIKNHFFQFYNQEIKSKL